MIGVTSRAGALCKKLLSYAGPLKLYAEEIDASTLTSIGWRGKSDSPRRGEAGRSGAMNSWSPEEQLGTNIRTAAQTSARQLCMGICLRAGHADGDLIIVDLEDRFTALMLGTPPVSTTWGLSSSRARQAALSTRCGPGPGRAAGPWPRRTAHDRDSGLHVRKPANRLSTAGGEGRA
jgi:hypothetical protein